MIRLRIKLFRARAAIVLCVALLAGGGCQHARVRFASCDGECAPIVTPPQAIHHTQFYAGGLFPAERSLNLGSLCEDGILEIHEYSSWLNGFWDNATYSIYAPKTIAVYCK